MYNKQTKENVMNNSEIILEIKKQLQLETQIATDYISTIAFDNCLAEVAGYTMGEFFGPRHGDIVESMSQEQIFDAEFEVRRNYNLVLRRKSA